jgi:pimeloyl-ACP methyl ester carboxylesterase
MRYLFLVVLAVLNCLAPEGAVHSKKEIDEKFRKAEIEPNYNFVKFGDRNIHVVSTGNKTNDTIIFVHGSPGTWDAYVDYLTDKALLYKYFMISYDRPGFGKSDSGRYEANLKKQGEILMNVVNSFSLTGKIILVGHSFGGPVIVQAAMDYPDKFHRLVILAGSIDPEEEKVEWYQNFANLKLVRYILPEMVDVANQEILPLKGELEKILNNYEKITIPVVFYQGGKDTLVPPGNAYFAKRKFVNSKFELVFEEELNHFIPWNRKEKVLNILLEEK